MKMNKILVPNETCLVEIVSNKNKEDHCVYFLDENGKIIDHLEISDCLISEIVIMIHHMFIINFTDQQFFNMKCMTNFNNIFEPNFIHYDDIYGWEMNEEMVKIIRFFGKLKNVYKFVGTKEYQEEEKIISNFITEKPTPIEHTSKEVHERGMFARAKMLEFISNWVY